VISDDLTVHIEEGMGDGARRVRLETSLSTEEALLRFGRLPLPPYLNREEEPVDRDRYQTVVAQTPGSVAAPTAGLHFTAGLLDRVRAAGVEVATVTLHVGPGTFRPVACTDVDEHPMHQEAWQVSVEAAEAVARTRGRGGRVWAVGTTVVRTLESAADGAGGVRAGSGETDLFIAPGFQFRVVDALLTNFHLPRSTLLMLVAALAGYDRIFEAYRAAMQEGYRFYSYGDAMLILPEGSDP
jgi:S-adenosylmethionine:tRNA ribosyltransferase-isomerase